MGQFTDERAEHEPACSKAPVSLFFQFGHGIGELNSEIDVAAAVVVPRVGVPIVVRRCDQRRSVVLPISAMPRPKCPIENFGLIESATRISAMASSSRPAIVCMKPTA